jgi:putative flavoprotein involved in K+ transport
LWLVPGRQAGPATSYWLSQAGVEHQLLERRAALGGAWQDRWDAFCLNTPNFSLALPGMPYDGPAPEGFIPRNDLIGHFRHYAESIGAPVRNGTDVTRTRYWTSGTTPGVTGASPNTRACTPSDCRR